MEANDPERLKMGKVFYRSLGVGVLNDTSIVKIQIEDSQFYRSLGVDVLNDTSVKVQIEDSQEEENVDEKIKRIYEEN